MLTGAKIIEEQNEGRLTISPFSTDNVNPNSYNCHIDNEIVMYDICNGECNPSCPLYVKKEIDTGNFISSCKSNKVKFLDPKKNNPTLRFTIPSEGYILEPGILYLAKTKESTTSSDYIANLDGRSSAARLGISVHITAGFGDLGFSGVWTLEMTVIHPVKIYPGMSIGQFYFVEPNGEKTILYDGKYMNSESVDTSKYYTEL